MTSSKCILWSGRQDRHGYGKVQFFDKTLNRTVETTAHRMVWQGAYGGIPLGMFVLHRCDVPLCVNPDHLFLGTQRDNMVDMYAKGRQGERNQRPVELTNKMICSDLPNRELANQLGLAASTVANV